uniref:Uncharacterized protein n=1 Tax=Anguilla anguilla TaxID=7936 RepID=A0A0E9WGL0_ANGAN
MRLFKSLLAVTHVPYVCFLMHNILFWRNSAFRKRNIL